MERRLLPVASVPVSAATSASPIISQSASNPIISSTATSLHNLASEESVRRDDPNQAQVAVASNAGAIQNQGVQAKRRGKKEGDGEGGGGDEIEDSSAAGAAKKKTKRRKVDHACVYCRLASLLTCFSFKPNLSREWRMFSPFPLTLIFKLSFFSSFLFPDGPI